MTPQTGSLATQLSLEQAMERDGSGEWTRRARWWLGVIDHHPTCHNGWTSDDLRRFAGDPPGVGNVLGAFLSQEVRAGRIEVIGRRKSTRPGRHRAKLNVYRGRT